MSAASIPTTQSSQSRPDLPNTDTSSQKVANAPTPSNASGKKDTSMNTSTEVTGEKPSDVPNPDSEYPPQLHAGKVGYGPEYAKKTGLSEKITGMKEELKGKVTKKPELVEQGQKRRAGELGKDDDDVNPFQKADEAKAGQEGGNANADANATSTHPQPNTSTTARQAEAGTTNVPQGNMPTEKGAKEEAATVAPEGTAEGDAQAREGVRTGA